MDYEILGAEDDEPTAPEPPSRPVGVLVVAVVALGALVAAALLFGTPGGGDAQDAVPASPTPTGDGYHGRPVSENAETPVPVTPPRAELSMGQVCDLVLAPGDRSMRVQFEMVNSGATGLRLRDVRPYFPLRGYLKLTHASAGGSCTDPGTGKAARSLAAGERVLITWDLALQQKCPKPAPVQVTARARMITGEQTWKFPLYDDLGAVPFTDC